MTLAEALDECVAAGLRAGKARGQWVDLAVMREELDEEALGAPVRLVTLRSGAREIRPAAGGMSLVVQPGAPASGAAAD